jgi:hypothetical protein
MKIISKGRSNKRRKLSSRVFLNKLFKEREKVNQSKKNEMKFMDKWSDYANMYGKRKKVKIEVFKSKDKKYYIDINPSIPKNGFGLLTKVIRRKPIYEKYVMKTKQFKKLEDPVHGISVGISKKGGHHGKTVYFQEYFYFDFNDKPAADKLFKFLSKYTRSVDNKKKRTKRTKRKL